MKAITSKEDRTFNQAQRGIGAQRLIDDELVKAWFEGEHKRLVSEMLGAEIADDQKRRDCALQIKMLLRLKSHLEAEAVMGRAAVKTMENQNGRG